MPQIFDVYTSAKDSPDRKNVFAPGESLQLNILHSADDDEVGRPYECRFHLEQIGLTIAYADEAFELLWPINYTFTAESSYVTRHRWVGVWWDSIPDVGDTMVTPGGMERVEALRAAQDANFNLLFWRGYWKFTAIVEMTEAASGRAFDIMTGWTYRIID